MGQHTNDRRRGWKITHVDGTTHGGYRWPLPMPGETAPVEATDIYHDNTGACPAYEGDGLCVVREGIGRHVTSGGIKLGNSIGLDLRWDTADELGRCADDEKIRVAKVEVVALFKPLDLIALANLSSADLSSANLRCANLRCADLRYANLRYANLRSADLSFTNLRSADLRCTDLRCANLRYAKYDSRTLWPYGFDPVKAGAVKS